MLVRAGVVLLRSRPRTPRYNGLEMGAFGRWSRVLRVAVCFVSLNCLAAFCYGAVVFSIVVKFAGHGGQLESIAAASPALVLPASIFFTITGNAVPAMWLLCSRNSKRRVVQELLLCSVGGLMLASLGFFVLFAVWLPYLPSAPDWVRVVTGFLSAAGLLVSQATIVFCVEIGRYLTARTRRARGRCESCGYDLRESANEGCPECGRGRLGREACGKSANRL